MTWTEVAIFLIAFVVGYATVMAGRVALHLWNLRRWERAFDEWSLRVYGYTNEGLRRYWAEKSRTEPRSHIEACRQNRRNS